MDKVKMRKRIQGKENYYVEMPENSEIHLVNGKDEIVLSVTMKSGKANVWGR